MATKIKTKFILNGTDNTLFEVNGYLYNTKKNKSFNHDYMLESKKYTIKKIEDRVNELSITRNIYIEPCKKSSSKKS